MSWGNWTSRHSYGWIGGGTSGGTIAEDLTGATFALLMDESSGSIVDEISAVILAQYSAANTYSIVGSTGYNPGITMNPVAGGFNKAGDTAALNLGTGDFNIFMDVRVDGTLEAFSEIFGTSIFGDLGTGFTVRALTSVNAANSKIYLLFVSTDTTSAICAWTGNEAGSAVFSGGVHTWEFRVDRTAGTVALLVDNISQGTVDISTLAGKTVNSSGLGVGCDYRAGINRNVPVTIWFIRTKKSVT